MADYHYGDIIILDYPYSERRVSKRRPAVVLNQDRDRDLLVARVTSTVYDEPTDILLQDWRQAGLNVPSHVLLTKIATVGEFDVIRYVGRLTVSDKGSVLGGLRKFVDSMGERGT